MKRFLIIAGLIALVALGVFWFSRTRAQQAAQTLNNLQTVTAGRGPLVATVGATGSVRSNQSAVLLWQTSGSVDEVLPAVGDLVEKGATLANLRRTSLAQNIILAEAELITARRALDNLLEPATELTLAQARQAIADAEKAVDRAQQQLDSLNSTAAQTDIDSARSAVVLAENALEKARSAFQPYENKAEDNLIRATLQNALAQRQKEYDAAVRRLNNMLGVANATDLSVAASNLEVAHASLVDARENYDKLLNGADQEDIVAAETRIAAIQATLALALIDAPFAGTITQVSSLPGDQVSPGTLAFQLDDLTRLLVEVRVSEVDINRIRLGQNARLTFDGILNTEYAGVIVEVDPVGSTVQGVVEFVVTIELNDPDESVKPGMTAAVNIVTSELENVLLVPNRAVRLIEGNRVVYILKDGVPVPVDVKLGLSSDVESEVIESDLKEGDIIVLNPPSQFNAGGPPPFVNR